MSKYVMSDLHGCYDQFIKLLELINFKEEDELYILGDVIDRGPDSLKIIDYISPKNNITLLLGNHEQMYIEWFETGYPYDWFGNGGRLTFEELCKKPIEFQYSLYSYFRKLPRFLVVDKYILVHAGLDLSFDYKDLSIDEILKAQTLQYNIWGRSHIGKYYELPSGHKIICGHTPVQNIASFKNMKDTEIVKHGSYVYLDCGGVFGGKHACLRLDDFKEFYV